MLEAEDQISLLELGVGNLSKTRVGNRQHELVSATGVANAQTASREPLRSLSPRELQDHLVAIAHEARAFDVREYEDRPSAESIRELVPKVLETVDSAIALLEAGVIEKSAPRGKVTRSGLPRLGVSFYRAVDRVVAAEGREQLVDLASMARFELRAKADQLRLATDRAEQEPPEQFFALVVSLAASVLRKIAKVTTAMENALAEQFDLPAQLDFVTELATAQEVQQALEKFGNVVRVETPPLSAEIRGRLVSAGNAIARFICRDAYWHLRYDDRVELRKLQRRILDWLTSGSDDRDGLRLWQEVAAFSQLLDEIERRSELVADKAPGPAGLEIPDRRGAAKE